MDIIVYYLLIIPGAVITVSLHEYVKAAASTTLGDTVPKREGRCTLNPMKHVDVLGLICMVVFPGMGWGKPVNTSAIFYKDKKKGTLIVYVLPSIANLLMAAVLVCAAAVLRNLELAYANTVMYYVYSVARLHAGMNVTFALFNIIPVYPLDGAKVLSVFLKPQTVVEMTRYEKILQLVLIFLMISGIIGGIIYPVRDMFLIFA